MKAGIPVNENVNVTGFQFPVSAENKYIDNLTPGNW